MQAIGNPFPIYLGLDGLALALGFIYIGVENEDPETSPQAVFWDALGASSATQPIRTISGYLDRNGSPAQIYTQGKYSIRVRNAGGEQVFYAASAGVSEAVNAGDPYYVHTQFLGDAPSAQQIVCKHVFGVAVSWEADLPGQAFFDCGTVPTGNAAFDMRHGGVSFGTLTIDTTGDVTVASDAQDFDKDGVFTLVAPDSATDAADIAGTIVGTVS